jgi:hypothetical protein
MRALCLILALVALVPQARAQPLPPDQACSEIVKTLDRITGHRERGRFDHDSGLSPSTGDDPGRVEPAVRRAVIGEPRDVPMADEWGVGGPDRRSSTDVDHAVGIAGNHV